MSSDRKLGYSRSSSTTFFNRMSVFSIRPLNLPELFNYDDLEWIDFNCLDMCPYFNYNKIVEVGNE